MSETKDYYVYVYIDPRNYEEFYYGQGRGSRKEAHLSDSSISAKTDRISEIKKAGLQPIIRVVARNLDQHDALLVEKTLLWKIGKTLTNVSSGHYAENFRPPFKMHEALPGFDYKNGIYYYNVGEGPHRSWDDYVKFGFISAGQGAVWRDSIQGFHEGDILAAYLKRRGFVGIGKVISKARPIRECTIGGKLLLSHDLYCKNMGENHDSDEKCEYVAAVEWIRTASDNPKWKPKSGLFTTTHVRASLAGQPETLKYLEQEFDLDLRELADQS